MLKKAQGEIRESYKNKLSGEAYQEMLTMTGVPLGKAIDARKNYWAFKNCRGNFCMSKN